MLAGHQRKRHHDAAAAAAADDDDDDDDDDDEDDDNDPYWGLSCWSNTAHASTANLMYLCLDTIAFG